VTRREEDDDYLDPFCYTDLLDIFKIIDASRPLFATFLSKAYAANRHLFSIDFMRLNRIRNAIMHPVKPRKWSQEDFNFVRQMAAVFQDVARRAESPIPSLQPIESQLESQTPAGFSPKRNAPGDPTNVH
jgi:hypothetical protein